MRNHSSKQVGGRHSVLQLACWTQDLNGKYKCFVCIGGDRDIDLDDDDVDHNTFPVISMAVKPLK